MCHRRQTHLLGTIDVASQEAEGGDQASNLKFLEVLLELFFFGGCAHVLSKQDGAADLEKETMRLLGNHGHLL